MYDWTGQEQFDLNYRKGNLDITGSLAATTYSVGQEQVLTVRSMAGGDVLSLVGKNHTRGRANYLVPKLQVNYIVNQNHSFGAWYRYNDNFYQNVTAHIDTRVALGDTPQEHTISDIFHDWKIRSHNTSMYYNGTIGKWNIDFNADGV